MTTPASFRCVVISEGKPRAILSVGERKSGDLVLSLRPGHTLRPPGRPLNRQGPHLPILEHRYSVHKSPDSNGLNTIKQTMELANGQVRALYNFTAAIKRNNLFAPILARRCSHFFGRAYDFNPKRGRNFVLAQIDASRFSLVFAVFVGAKDRLFALPYVPTNFQVAQLPLSEFRLVIIWSFLAISAHESSTFVFVRSMPESTGYKEGADETGCVQLFDRWRVQLKTELIQLLRAQGRTEHSTSSEYLSSVALAPIFSDAPYFREGILAPEYLAWVQSLLPRGLLSMEDLKKFQGEIKR